MSRCKPGDYINMGVDLYYDKIGFPFEDVEDDEEEIYCSVCEDVIEGTVIERNGEDYCAHCINICFDCGEHSPKGLTNVGKNKGGVYCWYCPECAGKEKKRQREIMKQLDWR